MCGRVRASFWSLVERRAESAWRDSSSRDRELLRSVLMTTCDVAAITKPWHVQLRQTDRQTDRAVAAWHVQLRQTDRQTDRAVAAWHVQLRQTDRQTDRAVAAWHVQLRQTDRQTDRADRQSRGSVARATEGGQARTDRVL